MKIFKNTGKALLLCALTLVICLSLFAGSTYAWFSESESSDVNKIVSGNLEVGLEYKTNWDDSWENVDETTNIFNPDALYEPGYTEIVFLRVSNPGKLALKCSMSLNVASEKPSKNISGGEIKISDYLLAGTYYQNEFENGYNCAEDIMPAMFSNAEQALINVEDSLIPLSQLNEPIMKDIPVLAKEQTSMVMAIVLTMPDTTGNNANYDPSFAAPEIELGVNLIAAQYNEEKDSFDNSYDENAEYPSVIYNEDSLSAALENGGTIILTRNLELTKDATVNKDTIINLNGFTLKGQPIESRNGRIFQLNGGANLTVKNGALESEGYAIVSSGNGNSLNTLLLDNVNINAGILGVYHNGSNYGIDATVDNSNISCTDYDSTGIFISGSAYWGSKKNCLTVNNSTVEGNTAIEVKHTDVTVNASELTAFGTTPTLINNQSGGCAYGYALALTNNGDSEASYGIITINSGSFVGPVGIKAMGEGIALNESEYTDNAAVYIYGGSFG